MEPEEMLFLLHTLQSDWLFIDVGANVGAYTLLAAKVVGSKTFAFEPTPSATNKLKQQIKLNLINSLVTVYSNAIGSATKTVLFTDFNSIANHICSDEEDYDPEGIISINVVSLDDIFLE